MNILFACGITMDAFENNLRLAFEAHNIGQHAEAEALCRKLLSEGRPDARLCFLLGMILHRLARDREAIEPLRHAASMAPQDAAIFNGLGCVFHSLKNYPRAVENFQQAIALSPGQADLYYSLGNALFPLGEIEAAAAAFRRSVELNPQDAQSWNNLGKTLKELNRLDESLAAYDRALAAEPDYVLAHYGHALSLLASGNLPAGFREYEWRPQRMPREFPQPKWRGESLASRTLFLHAEQGFGDAILAARYLPQLRKDGARVVLECRPELKSLFTYSKCADGVIAHGEPIPPFDCWTSLISVAGTLGVTLETIPNQVPCLTAPSGEKFPGANPKIGLVWAGNPGHNDDARRSLRLSELMPVLHTPGRDFYSLQVPVPQRDQLALATFPNIVNLGGR
ncbi:MAG TPA: tetratricopeptide repeat protein, partial [Verrucomicrobiae bacterium]|nr:tetratricopeptide repeat protein [Verrucomicrobiae bacterium]